MIKFIHKNILNPCQVVVDNLVQTEGTRDFKKIQRLTVHSSVCFPIKKLILKGMNLTIVSVNFHVASFKLCL